MQSNLMRYHDADRLLYFLSKFNLERIEFANVKIVSSMHELEINGTKVIVFIPFDFMSTQEFMTMRSGVHGIRKIVERQIEYLIEAKRFQNDLFALLDYLRMTYSFMDSEQKYHVSDFHCDFLGYIEDVSQASIIQFVTNVIVNRFA